MTLRTMAKMVGATLVVAATGILTTTNAWGVFADPNFGGYSSPVVSGVSADITVPATAGLGCVTLKPSMVEAWVALVRGPFAVNVGVVVKCNRGSPTTYVSGIAGTTSFHFPVNGGDVVSVSASETSTVTTITADDMTSTASAVGTFVGASPTPVVAWFGDFSTSSVLPTFGSVTFSSAEVDGAQLSIPTATAHRLLRHHAPVVTAGTLSSGSFTLTDA